jgi:hypothetical protein
MAWIICKCGVHNSIDERDRLSGWTCGICYLKHLGLAKDPNGRSRL